MGVGVGGGLGFVSIVGGGLGFENNEKLNWFRGSVKKELRYLL